jgi:hypothetical protein
MPGKTNVKRAKEAKKRIEDNREGRKWFKASQGDNQLRLLPPWADHLDWPFFETKNHRLGDKTIFICPKAHDGETFCYTCDVVIPALYKGNDKDQARAYNIRGTNRIFCNVLERDNEEVGCQMWGISTQTYDQLVSYFSDPDYGDITDIEAGHDIVLTRKGTTKDDTSYTQRAKPNKTPVNNDDVLANLFDLDEACGGAPTEEQKRMLKEVFGTDYSDVDGAEEAEVTDSVEEEEEEEGDASFDFNDTTEADPEPKEAPKAKKASKPKKETEEASGDLVPIQAPSKLKGKMKDIYLTKAQGTSTCFGKLFDEDADECVSSCQAVIECMTAFGEE